jgi:hypothetical protein
LKCTQDCSAPDTTTGTARFPPASTDNIHALGACSVTPAVSMLFTPAGSKGCFTLRVPAVPLLQAALHHQQYPMPVSAPIHRARSSAQP